MSQHGGLSSDNTLPSLVGRSVYGSDTTKWHRAEPPIAAVSCCPVCHHAPANVQLSSRCPIATWPHGEPCECPEKHAFRPVSKTSRAPGARFRSGGDAA